MYHSMKHVADTRPTKLQEYLTTVYAASERLEFADRVERPTSASSPTRRNAGTPQRSVGLYHIASAAESKESVASRTGSLQSSHVDEHSLTTHNARSILDMFRHDSERKRSLRKLGAYSTDGAGAPQAQLTAPQDASHWTTTSLATGATGHPSPRLGASTHGSAQAMLSTRKPPGDLVEKSSQLANELHDARQQLAALYVVFHAERQRLVLQAEVYERAALEEERATQMRLWSQHLTLLYRLKAKKAILRPSQIYLESLREKDALEIKALRGQVALLSSELAAHKQSHSSGDDRGDLRTVDSVTDTERLEWNEVYRNMQQCIASQREAITDRDRQIAALTLRPDHESTPQAQPRYVSLQGGLRQPPALGATATPMVQRGALSPSDR